MSIWRLEKCSDIIRSFEKCEEIFQKCVIVEDWNFLEKDNSFSGSRSVIACLEVLKKHFSCNLSLIFFWLEIQKVVTKYIFNLKKIIFIIRTVNLWEREQNIFFCSRCKCLEKNHQCKGLGSAMTWLEVWKSIREKPVKKVSLWKI